MTAPFTVTVDLAGTVADLTAMAARSENLTPVWQGAADTALRQMFAGVFATRGGSIGKPWAPLSPATEALKAKAHRQQFGPLRFFDRLYRSLTVRSGVDQIREVTPKSLTMGTSVPYAHLHQDGWTMRSMFGRPVAPRSILPRKLAPEDGLPVGTATAIQEAMLAYVLGGVA